MAVFSGVLTEKPPGFVVEKELSISELFGKSFELMRSTYFKVLPIFVAFGILSTILATAISIATPSLSLPSNVANLTTQQIDSFAGLVGRYVGYTLANLFVTWSVLYFAAALGIWRMNRQVKQLPAQSGPNYLSLVLTTVLSVVIIEAGLFLIVIGALIFATMLYLVLVAGALEGRSAFDAMRRSRELISGKWFKTFALLIGVQAIIWIVSMFLGDIAGIFFTGTASMVAATIGTNFVMALAFPLVSASMLVLYYSSLAKREQIVERPPSLYDNLRPQPIPGFPISQNSFCPKCGAAVTREEKFCHNCGNLLQA